MATQRIPSLWSMLWRTTEVRSPAARSARAAAFRAYHLTRRRDQEHLPQQRYGNANEPPPHLGGGKGLGPPSPASDGQMTAQTKIGETYNHESEKEAKVEKPEKNEVEDQKREPATLEGKVSPHMADPMLDSHEEPPSDPAPDSHSTPENKTSESVLYTAKQSHQDKTNETHAEEHHDKTFDEHSPPIKAPHIDRPRYIHHFDTYGLVKRLADGGWDEKRAITIMKAVRLMLADNIDLAKEALVSKSFLENEAYLFRAACAELRTEVTTRRKSEQEKMRTERTQLQHEVDVISQRLGQESAALKDDLKGMFDDRKMAVRNEQRDTESKIQQLNYKITVMLQADAKSEVEGLRWLMTRRVLFTLAAVILMTVGGLKMVSDAYAMEAEEASKRLKIGAGKSDASKGGGGYQGEMVVKDGDNPGFVSLG